MSTNGNTGNGNARQSTELVLPESEWKGGKFRQLTGKSTYGPLSGFGPDVLQHAGAVAYIRRADGEGGTGFLVAPDLLLTNQHVLRNAADAAGCRVWFNYLQADPAGNPLNADLYTCTPNGPDGFFAASPALDFAHGGHTDAQHLDYALVRIKMPTTPGAKYSFVPITGYIPTISLDMPLTIIQHPMHRPTEVGQGDHQLRYKDTVVIQYVTDTEPGASGSPVFNKFWQLVGLHHSAVELPPTFGGGHGNEGIFITAITADLKAKFPQLTLPTHA
jgi:hypothetical protein